MAETPSEPPAAVLLRLIGGYRVTQALYVVTKLGIPDRIALEPKDAESLARETGTHPQRLFRVLRALASVGVLAMDETSRFGLTDMGRLLTTDSKGSLAAPALFAGEEAYRAWGDLLHSVRTGETAFDHVYGMGHFDYLGQHPEASALFNRLMASSVGWEGDPLAGYDLERHHVLVDVGGGKGVLIAQALRSFPRLEGILFDQSSALTEAPEVLRAAGVAERCRIIAGSAFDGVPPGGDVYVMSRILHDWPDEKAARLLANCRKVMAPGAVLLLVDGVLPEGVPPPSRAWLDLVMLAVTGGRERTEKEWRGLLREAGFELTGFRPVRANQDLIEARAVAL